MISQFSNLSRKSELYILGRFANVLTMVVEAGSSVLSS